ncbi:MAG: N-formylglutamate amidohydrolase [Nitrospiraceae bacterium]|nr:MAG: N-formylglutamate amidohydrolase [Nitrospiraceae bacterium]
MRHTGNCATAFRRGDSLPDKPLSIFITCEHGGNRFPKRYAPLFRDSRALLESHRGYDAGALEFARKLAQRLKAPLFFSAFTRLLIDLNRSPRNPNRFSEITRRLGRQEKASIEECYYTPYREEVQAELVRYIRNDMQVLHISVHSFTPTFHGKLRAADLGLLYDPSRKAEAEFCILWQSALRELVPDLFIRRNYPYRGTSDGFTRYLRDLFSENSYLGIELEVNQKFLSADGAAWLKLQQSILKSLSIIISRTTQ